MVVVALMLFLGFCQCLVNDLVRLQALRVDQDGRSGEVEVAGSQGGEFSPAHPGLDPNLE